MALPIAPTPILEGEEAVDFLKKIQAELKDRKTLVATPQVERVRRTILSNAKRSKE